MVPRKDGRTIPQRFAERFLADVQQRWNDLTPDERRDVAMVRRMSRARNRRAVVAFAHNGGVPGPMTLSQLFAQSVAVLEGWL